ncbi:MAG TPA: trigger factor [Hyphomicrobiaceae bacterium]|nr:trigger factor [Hyphomicrobiaceae bacterium]
MQVSVTNSDGLKRTLRIVIDQGELGERFSSRLGQVKETLQIKGFRRGKVPEGHIRKLYGRSLMAEVVQQAVEETTQKVIAERKERPAFQPKIDFPEDKDEIERVMSGGSDFAYSMSFEVLPEISVSDLSALKIERLVADVPDEAVDKALNELAERNTKFTPEDGRAAEDGDQLTIDFVGKIDGVEFEGGKAEDVPLVLGKGAFIPGFEDGLKGAKAGEDRVVTATFPAEYQVATLAGKTAHFDVKVKAVAKPEKPAIDDELAKGFGADSLDVLKDRIRSQIQREYEQISRAKMKRAMLDELDKLHAFELPPTLVDNEFEAIWGQLQRSMEQANKTFENEGKKEDDVRAEYRRIAERRVRLGLVLGEIGEKGKIEVTQDELRSALIEQARRFPGQERMVYEYFEKTPGAVAQLRAPIFEEKVVDYIAQEAKPTERKVGHEELLKPIDETELSVSSEATTPSAAG